MAEFLQQFVNGISLGSIYALIALGYTMVYGIIKLINFAHGDVMMIGAYVGLVATSILGLDVFTSLLLAMVVCAVMGVLIERLAYKPLRNSTRIAALITAIGVSLLLEYVMVWGVGAQQRTYPTGILTDVTYRVFNGQVSITSKDMLILIVSIGLTVVLTYIVHRTKIGKAMRAVSYDAEAAMLMGINVNNTISVTFAIGSALAAAAGVLIGVYYNSVDPLMGIMPGLKAFVAAVLGGIGIIPGALLGSYLMGIVEAFVSGYGSSMYRDAVAFGVLILILIIKPVGLLGKNVREKV